MPNVEGFPTHASLDRVSPNNPVVLTHASGHAAFVNGKALQVSGIDRKTKNPAGGEILKDAAGEPTGLLRETADGLIKRTDAATAAEAAKRARDGCWSSRTRKRCRRASRRSQDAGSPLATIDVMKKMVDEGKMGVRLWVMIRQPNDVIGAEAGAVPDDRLRRRPPDGARDQEADRRRARVARRVAARALRRQAGQRRPEHDDASRTSKRPRELAIENGYQLCVHAIGDRANRETLEHLRSARSSANPDQEEPALARRACAAPQRARTSRGSASSASSPRCRAFTARPTRRTCSPAWATKRAEEGAYVWQKLMKSGAIVANGTDAPVEDVDPIANYYATVSRRLATARSFYPAEKMDRQQALQSYTRNSAFAAFEETNRGTLRRGKFADITVLSKDITRIPESEILSTKVVYTIVAGKVVYKKP